MYFARLSPSVLNGKLGKRVKNFLSSRLEKYGGKRCFKRLVRASFCLSRFIRSQMTERRTIVEVRGDWLRKPANIKIENNDSAGYVGSSLAVQILFFLFTNCD